MDNQKELNKWKRMSGMGKRNFIVKDGILHWGIPTGLLYAIFYQLISGGFSLNNFIISDFIIIVIIGIFVFSVTGMLASFLTWRRLEKKYLEE